MQTEAALAVVSSLEAIGLRELPDIYLKPGLDEGF
jgi:hypothetical protein